MIIIIFLVCFSCWGFRVSLRCMKNGGHFALLARLIRIILFEINRFFSMFIMNILSCLTCFSRKKNDIPTCISCLLENLEHDIHDYRPKERTIFRILLAFFPIDKANSHYNLYHVKDVHPLPDNLILLIAV
jgi:hypothetical protein